MPLRPLKICNALHCNELTREKYCDKHKTQQQEETKHYNKHSRNKTITSFYKSTDWKRTRQLALLRDNYTCQRCLKESKITRADMVHHSVEVREDWSKRLELSNLISLCNSCHNKVHGVKSLG
ncbi:HNH endonuclease [Bacillus velezensis]|uniref:HNH endonuclease n=1 Tax=Bacillus velezensis TaxID=492670 RepID=UPI002DBA311A|nr:HNH endonuclease [Bacillus velezensis]MEC0405738.1 HNH endonuclease [Bacillus velezensis]